MNLLRYWLRLFRIYFHFRKKSTYLPYFPIRLWIEATSRCNFRCIMCPNKHLEKQDKGLMEFGLYQKIIEEAKDFVFDINLAHRGESLLHPQIAEMIRTANQYRIFTKLHTNGSLLTKELSREIISAGLDRLSFSFDGFKKETYEKIRKGGDFNKTVTNIKQFLEIKKSLNSKKPETVIEVIHFDHFSSSQLKKEQELFKNRFKGLPLDSFVTKELHNWAGEIEKEQNKHKYSKCPFPWNALVIFWNGDVLPCTQDFFGHYTVGDVKEQSLKQIWNSSPMVELREKLIHQDIESLKTCSHCDRVWRQRFLGVPKEYLWEFISKKMP
ncbi:MAG: radical SAM protein [Candidatus Aminicenantes bacterium]|nr:radical SAM protein [Candidatus Aminicenantes bacterium]